MTTPRTLPPNIFQTQSHSEVLAFVQLSRSFNLPSTLIIRCHVSTRATKEASCFWGCGQFLTLIIKRILDIKRIFPCNFGNKRMRLLTRVYGISLVAMQSKKQVTIWLVQDAISFSHPLLPSFPPTIPLSPHTPV